MTLRASRLPLAMACPPSLNPAPYSINDEGEPQRLGTAVHEALAKRLSGQINYFDESLFELLAVKYTLAVSEIKLMTLRAWSLWQQIADYFRGEKMVEQAMSVEHPLAFTGHADVIRYEAASRTIHLCDHKTGWIDADHRYQTKGYGVLALELFPEAERIHTVVLRVRDYVTDHDTYTREELTAWAGLVKQRLASTEYSAGPHCTYCHHRPHCQPHADWIRSNIQLLLSRPLQETPVQLTPQLVRAIYDARQSIEKLLKDTQEMLKSLASVNMGSLDCGDAYELRLETEVRQVIQFVKAWPILSKRLAPEQQDAIFRVGKTALSKIIKGDAADGQKTNAWLGLLQELEQAGAMEQVSTDKLLHRKKSLTQGDA